MNRTPKKFEHVVVMGDHSARIESCEDEELGWCVKQTIRRTGTSEQMVLFFATENSLKEVKRIFNHAMEQRKLNRIAREAI